MQRDLTELGESKTGVWPAVKGFLPMELVLLLVLAVAYTIVRGFATPEAASAFRHARALVSFEGPIREGLEIPLNAWLTSHAWIAVPACYFYALMHFAATPAVLIWARLRHANRYMVLWWTLVVATAGALLIYAVYPVAPPRLLPGSGAIDTLSVFHDWGWWGAAASAPRGLGDMTNQFAALPSMHFGWALWCGIALQMSGQRIVRWLGLAYPTLLGIVVIATGNHFLVDVVLGGLFIVMAYVGCLAVKRLAAAQDETGEPTTAAAG